MRTNCKYFRLVAALVVLMSLNPAWSEPGVALLLDSRQPGQSALSASARKCLALLIRQNQLLASQFSLQSVDAANPQTWGPWRRDYALTPQDLPALAFVTMSGNRVASLHNLVRRYKDPLAAAEEAFRCASVHSPTLIKTSRLQTAVQLASDPAGASVSLGSQILGTTPCQVDLKPGHYRLTVHHPDCLPVTKRVDLQLGQRSVLNVSLDRAPARLNFESLGVPMSIRIDDQDYGLTPVRVDLPAGPHQIRASAPEQATIATVTRAEANLSVKVRLTPSPARIRVAWAGTDAQGFATTSALAPIVNTGVAVALSRVGGLGIPFFGLPQSNPVQNVELDKQAIRDRAQQTLTTRPRLLLTDKDPDCSLRLGVMADPNRAVGVVQILDPKGAELRTFSAQRDMPSFTLDAQGSATVRVSEVAEDVMRQAMDWIIANVRPSADTTTAGLETSPEGPLGP